MNGVVFIAMQMIITIAFSLFLGKRLGFSEDYRFLIASGNAVCGSSAIAATAPVIGANEEDKGIAITVVNVTGTLLMFILPLLAGTLYRFETVQTSALLGGILQSVGHVVASGNMVNESVKDLATLFKIVRILFLVFVVLGLGSKKTKQRK